MNKISVELVPRSEEELKAQLDVTKSVKADVDFINIPDLLRLPVRSWEGAAMAQDVFAAAMPHIRAMDVDLMKPLTMASYILEHNIHSVLVIEGDPPQDMKHTVYPTESTDVIRKFREELPRVKVYAGIDQYRGSMQQELYRIRRKLQAGAAGFFTQPFFDMRFLTMYEEMLDGIDVFWGISPIQSKTSQSYWEQKNHVVFPKNFEPTFEWSVKFGREVMAHAAQENGNVYLMPIKANLEEYLEGVLA